LKIAFFILAVIAMVAAFLLPIKTGVDQVMMGFCSGFFFALGLVSRWVK
jgi:hypothetical protein